MLFMVRPDAKSVTFLADILETIEVTADELMDQRFSPQELEFGALDGDSIVQARLAALRGFVREVRDLELKLLTNLEQARVRARTVARTDWRLRPIMSLFTSGTQPLADHIASPQGRAAMRFDGGSEVFPFLRSRELLAPMAEHYDGAGELLVTDSFRLLGLVKLRDLLERCEVALNALDAHYDLYDWPTEDTAAQEDVITALRQATLGPAPVSAVTVEPTLVAAEVAEPDLIRAEAPITAIRTLTEPAVEHASEPQEAAPVAPGEATNWGEAVSASSDVAAALEVAPHSPSKEALAVAEAAAEDGLKSLSERLADLRDADDAAPAATVKSDAA